MKRIKLAGIQMQSSFGNIQENLEHASAYIEGASRQGAQRISANRALNIT